MLKLIPAKLSFLNQLKFPPIKISGLKDVKLITLKGVNHNNYNVLDEHLILT